MSSEITPINKKLAIISGNGDLPYNILESAVSNGWNGVVIDIADNQKLKSQSNWKIYDFKIGNIGKIFKKVFSPLYFKSCGTIPITEKG